MYRLSPEDLLQAWESGHQRHLVDRALLLLALADPAASPSDLSALSIGQRNSRLLALRRNTFGPWAECFATCPECEAALEFTLDLTTLPSSEPVQSSGHLTTDGLELDFRLPISKDLAAIAPQTDVALARQQLIERCILQATRADQPVAINDLPESSVLALANAILDLDPPTEIQFELDCAECSHTWEALFDIAAFLWTEVETQVKRLLHEVHTLARAYGWSEADILSLSAMRRNFYLELAA